MVCYYFSLHIMGASTRVSGSFFTAGRLICVAGREGYLPALFGRLHPTRKTPLNAMLLQASITIAFIVLGGGFRSLINFAVVASWAFYFLTVRLAPGTCVVSMTQLFKGPGSRDFEN